jgi:hypothetical protein
LPHPLPHRHQHLLMLSAPEQDRMKWKEAFPFHA